MISQAFEAAHHLGAELLLLHISPTTDTRHRDNVADAPWYPTARQLVTAALNAWPDKYPDVTFRTHYRLGDPTEILTRYTHIADVLIATPPSTAQLQPCG